MTPCRQVLLWSVPSIAVLLGIFWFRKKRDMKSDPGGRERMRSLREELAEALKAQAEAIKSTPVGKADRAIIKSAPIDIVPNGVSSQRSSPLELTDEEVDLEIEKIIMKKSLDKDRKSTASYEKHTYFEVCNKETGFVVAGSPKQIASFKDTEDSNGIMEKCNSSHDESSQSTLENVDSSLESNDDCIQTDRTSIAQVEVQPENGDDTELNNNIINEPSNSNDSTSNELSTQQSRHISERDSANHSPLDPMLASPSMCHHFSDNHSEGSSDSGKGCSEAASPPPSNLNIVPSETGLRIHQFVIQQCLVGLLIGKHGSFVTQIKAKTGATVFVKKHPDSVKMKICAIEGTQSEIETALDMIKEKFPEKRFPTFSTQEISAELYQRLIPLVPEFLQLQLVESVNNETIITCLVSAGHFFLQQPLHPTFPSLHALHRLMANTYQNPDVPSLPRPIKEDTICAAPTENNWYRAQVISTSEESDTSVVKLVDFGGYLTVENDQLKQIRSDFMTLPFQATEALLAFVKPTKDEWTGEALRIMAGLTAGQLLQAQVAGYDEQGVPLVHLYLAIGAQQIIFLNRELVERGLAQWDLPAES